MNAKVLTYAGRTESATPGFARGSRWTSVMAIAFMILLGITPALSGVQAVSDRELLVTLAFPFPAWPAALAALPAAVVSPAGAGAGPFRRDAQGRLLASEHHWRGLPYPDSLALSAPDPRAVARGFDEGTLDLALRPEAAAGGEVGPPYALAFAAVNGRRLGGGAPAVRQVLAALGEGLSQSVYEQMDMQHRVGRGRIGCPTIGSWERPAKGRAVLGGTG